MTRNDAGTILTQYIEDTVKIGKYIEDLLNTEVLPDKRVKLVKEALELLITSSECPVCGGTISSCFGGPGHKRL